MKIHPLAEKIWAVTGCKIYNQHSIDQEIRKWLGEKAEVLRPVVRFISDKNGLKVQPLEFIYEVLDLTQEPECSNPHDFKYFIHHRFNRCPHCGEESPMVIREGKERP